MQNKHEIKLLSIGISTTCAVNSLPEKALKTSMKWRNILLYNGYFSIRIATILVLTYHLTRPAKVNFRAIVANPFKNGETSVSVSLGLINSGEIND